jgi:hypothetical protein
VFFVQLTKIIEDTESDRPRQSIIPTAKLTDASNSSRLALKSHQAAANAQRAAEAQKLAELKSAQQAAEAGVGVTDSTNEASAVPSRLATVWF